MNVSNGQLRQVKIDYLSNYIYENLISANRSTEYSIEFTGMDIKGQRMTRKRLKQISAVAAEYVIDRIQNEEEISTEVADKDMATAIRYAFENTDFTNV
jgi:hypothetical protein